MLHKSAMYIFEKLHYNMAFRCVIAVTNTSSIELRQKAVLACILRRW